MDPPVVGGMTEIVVPALGNALARGHLAEWLVAPGQAIHRGESIAVVRTDRGEVVVEAPDDSIVQHLLVAAGAQVSVGMPLARVQTFVDLRERARARHPATVGASAAGVPARHPPMTRPAPIARIPMEAPPAAPATSATVTPLHPDLELLHADSRALTRASHEIPHYHLQRDIDLTSARLWASGRNGDGRRAPDLTGLLLWCVTQSLLEEPTLNGHYDEGEFIHSDSVHLAVTVALTGGGSVSPTLAHAERLSMDEMLAAHHDLVARAGAGKLRSTHLAMATATVTVLGGRGADLLMGLIHPPQVCFIAIGRVSERPWAAGGMLGSRFATTATLAGDHRVSDPLTGSRFLESLSRRVARPLA